MSEGTVFSRLFLSNPGYTITCHCPDIIHLTLITTHRHNFMPPVWSFSHTYLFLSFFFKFTNMTLPSQHEFPIHFFCDFSIHIVIFPTLRSPTFPEPHIPITIHLLVYTVGFLCVEISLARQDKQVCVLVSKIPCPMHPWIISPHTAKLRTQWELCEGKGQGMTSNETGVGVFELMGKSYNSVVTRTYPSVRAFIRHKPLLSWGEGITCCQAIRLDKGVRWADLWEWEASKHKAR